MRCVCNGVRQGRFLSPFLFAVYLDGLLVELSKSGVGCHWESSFAGAFSYVHDVVLLAPCVSAMRTMHIDWACKYGSNGCDDGTSHGYVVGANNLQCTQYRLQWYPNSK